MFVCLSACLSVCLPVYLSIYTIRGVHGAMFSIYRWPPGLLDMDAPMFGRWLNWQVFSPCKAKIPLGLREKAPSTLRSDSWEKADSLAHLSALPPSANQNHCHLLSPEHHLFFHEFSADRSPYGEKVHLCVVCIIDQHKILRAKYCQSRVSVYSHICINAKFAQQTLLRVSWST